MRETMKRLQNVGLEAQSFHQRFGQPPGICNAGWRWGWYFNIARPHFFKPLFICANDQGGIRARLPSIITTRSFWRRRSSCTPSALSRGTCQEPFNYSNSSKETKCFEVFRWICYVLFFRPFADFCLLIKDVLNSFLFRCIKRFSYSSQATSTISQPIGLLSIR